MKFLSRLKSVDFYKKLPTDLTEATLTGASISIVASVVIVFLLIAEFSSFLALKTEQTMVVDQSRSGDLLRINFNVTFPELSCEFATLDVSDALGTKKLNLTRTVRKIAIDNSGARVGVAMRDEKLPVPKYHSEDENEATLEDLYMDGAYDYDFNGIPSAVDQPISHEVFKKLLERYPIVVINFYAPWCPWCQRLEPAWLAASKEIHDKHPESDRRIRLARVDCTVERKLCQDHFIQGFPSIRIFRSGSDEITLGGHKEHEAYHGDRTKEALVAFAESLVPTAGEPLSRVPHVRRAPKVSGCNFQGFVLVKKVPGTLHFHAAHEGHSFDHAALNTTHYIDSFFFGAKPSPSRLKLLTRLHPGGLDRQWADKLTGQTFNSANERTTHEHYMQVLLTTVQPRQNNALYYDAYEYTIHSHMYNSAEDATPAAKFSYQPSPIQIVVTEVPRKWYHFITTLCAIIGGVFTVAGIIDSIGYQTYKFTKKVELGKQG